MVAAKPSLNQKFAVFFVANNLSSRHSKALMRLFTDTKWYLYNPKTRMCKECTVYGVSVCMCAHTRSAP